MNKTMTRDEFLEYSKDQLAKASADPAELALKRLDALGRAVGVAKASFETSSSASIPVFTDPKPTQDVDPARAANVGKDNSFTTNLSDVQKQISMVERLGSHGIDEDGFPEDLNDAEVLEKGHKPGPDWGFDPS